MNFWVLLQVYRCSSHVWIALPNRPVKIKKITCWQLDFRQVNNCMSMRSTIQDAVFMLFHACYSYQNNWISRSYWRSFFFSHWPIHNVRFCSSRESSDFELFVQHGHTSRTLCYESCKAHASRMATWFTVSQGPHTWRKEAREDNPADREFTKQRSSSSLSRTSLPRSESDHLPSTCHAFRRFQGSAHWRVWLQLDFALRQVEHGPIWPQRSDGILSTSWTKGSWQQGLQFPLVLWNSRAAFSWPSPAQRLCHGIASAETESDIQDLQDGFLCEGSPRFPFYNAHS